MKLQTILRISRPRFWLYEAATFGLVGALAGTAGTAIFQQPLYWLFFVYFLIPANILIYGINDIFDYESDRLNEKKTSYETLVVPSDQHKVWKWIAFTNIPFFFFVPHTAPLLLSFGAYLFFAVFYSAKPIRAKSKPFIDSIFSAGHYVATGVFGYYLAGGTLFPLQGIIAGMLWAIAMHAFSAVPDIAADKSAGLTTIAVLLGKKATILLCSVLYISAAYLIRDIFPVVSIAGAVVYSIIMYLAYRSTTDESLFKLYTYFPIINTAVGAAVSISLFIQIFF